MLNVEDPPLLYRSDLIPGYNRPITYEQAVGQ